MFDEVTLFRFSAATWNSHRIHFDRRYATGVEGYPGLVVHGPLLATCLTEDAERELGAPVSVDFRASAPVFDEEEVDVYGRPGPGSSWTVQARKSDGSVAMQMTAAPAPSPAAPGRAGGAM